MIPGWYVLSKVNIFAGNILFVHDNSSAPEEPVFAKLGEPRLFHQADLIERQRILLWPHNRSIDARLSHGQTVHLERPKSISLEIFSGWNQIANGRLSLRSGSAGLRLHTAGAEGSNDKVAITDKSQPGLIFFGQFPSDSVWSISVPFNCERDLKDMIVRIEINYTTAKGEFLYACSQKISTILPITINVQDIFKRGALFSKFTVGTAVAVPVRISRCQVEGNSEYEITSPSLSSASVDVFARQPLSRIAKIQHVSGSHQEPSERKPAHTKLALHVDYRCVDQEILTVIESVFFNPLAGTPLQRFSRLLRPTLLASVHAVFSTQELEVAELLREINIGAFDEYSWGSSIICGLPPDLGQELAKWLKRWHEVRNHLHPISEYAQLVIGS